MKQHPATPTRIVLIVGDVGPIGGMERHALELIRGLRARGWPVTVISRSYHPDGVTGAQWVRVRTPKRPATLAIPLFLLAASWKHLRNRANGIVHLSGVASLLRADVSTIHFCAAALPRNLSRASRASLLFWLNSMVSNKFSLVVERIGRRSGGAKVWVAVSEGIAKDVRIHYPHLAQDIVVIANGVDTERFKPSDEVRLRTRRALMIDDDDPVAIFCGSEWRRKGLDIAMRAVAATSGHHLIIVGTGDQVSYSRLAESLGVSDRIHFVGQRADPEAFYPAADIFVMTSHYEGMSLAALEALACGLPLIVSSAPGSEEVVADGVNGWRVGPDPNQIAPLLEALHADPQLAVRLSVASRKRAAELTWHRAVAEYVRCYEHIAGADRRLTPSP